MPIVAACRADVPMDSNTLRRVPDKHGNLQRNPAALDEMEGILTARNIIIKAAKPIALRVDAPELALAGQPITDPCHACRAHPPRHPPGRHQRDRHARRSPPDPAIRRDRSPSTGSPPGAYTIDVAGAEPASPFAPVSSDILIWESPQVMPTAG